MWNRVLHEDTTRPSSVGPDLILANPIKGNAVIDSKIMAPLRSRSSNADNSTSDVKTGQGSKGHDMLAPFTPGWQTTDLNPLVIDKSEGSYVYDINGKKYLDALAGLWCTALGGSERRLVDAATAQLKKERNIVDVVNKIAPRFQNGIKAFSDSPIIGEIQGTGLILRTEFTDNNFLLNGASSRLIYCSFLCPINLYNMAFILSGAYFGEQCERHSMLVRIAAGDNIMMSPPFIISPEEVDELISIYGKALRDTEKRVQELKSQPK
ncbi:Pyridoxal phosphate (PLP)-dependent transferase superfamily protein [Trifolium repens]|nr:Pyridoxal phosphate (PLP)-dependent transferase superfamily protein [Trifolium repens]